MRPAEGRVASAAGDVVGGGLLVLGAVLASPLIRRAYHRWGADRAN